MFNIQFYSFYAPILFNYIQRMNPEFEIRSKSQKENQILLTSPSSNDTLGIRILYFSPDTTLFEDPQFEEIQQVIHVYEFWLAKNLMGQPEYKELFSKLSKLSKLYDHLFKRQNWEFKQGNKQLSIKLGINVLKAITLQKKNVRQLYSLKVLQELIKKQCKIKFVPRQIQEEKPTPTPEEDAVREKNYQYIKSDTFGLDAFDIKQSVITKNGKLQHQNKQRYVLGKSSIEYQNSFTIQIATLTKQERDPAIWIGVVDVKEKTKDHMQQTMDKVIAMSDQKKFYINGKYHIRNKVHEDKPWFTAQDIEADPEIQYQYLATELVEGDVITVSVNKNTGEVSWANKAGEVIGSCFSKAIQDHSIEWVPFVELWKTGDAIIWKK